MRDTGLADRLRAEGLKVIEVDGWKTRGSDTFHPRGSVNHHTAGPLQGNAPSLGVCINGRSDLPGPLCHVMMARDLTCYVIAAGRANHAGRGGWKGLSGNSSVYGLEVENTGLSNEPATDAQLDAMHRVHAAFLRGIDNPDVGLVCQHEEWAPTRKIDFHDLAFEAFRNGVAARLASDQPEDDMPYSEDDLKRIVADAVKPLQKQIDAIHRETVQSIPPDEKKGVKASGRWLIGDTWNRLERVLDRLPSKG